MKYFRAFSEDRAKKYDKNTFNLKLLTVSVFGMGTGGPLWQSIHII